MNPYTHEPPSNPGPPPTVAADQHKRFVSECNGTKADPAYRCGYLHDCMGHTTKRIACGMPSRTGMSVCRKHGGENPGAVAKARQLLLESADITVAKLFELSEHSDPKVALQATRGLLEYQLGKKATEPTDIVQICKEDPSQLGRLIHALENDAELMQLVEKLDLEEVPA